jgi:hypothetical protein
MKNKYKITTMLIALFMIFLSFPTFAIGDNEGVKRVISKEFIPDEGKLKRVISKTFLTCSEKITYAKSWIGEFMPSFSSIKS